MVLIFYLQETDLSKLLLISDLEVVNDFFVLLPILDFLSGNSQELLGVGCTPLLLLYLIGISMDVFDECVHKQLPLNAMERIAFDLCQVVLGEDPIFGPDMRISTFVFSNSTLPVDMLVDSWQHWLYRNCVYLSAIVNRYQIFHVTL